jgi:two-component system NtrC family response regulator
MANVLVIDDDQETCDTIADVVRRIGHEATCAPSFRDGLAASRSGAYAVALVDVDLPDGSGLDLLPLLRQNLPCPEVIIMTGSGDPDGAELAIKAGAWDYIRKPDALNEIVLPLTRALQYQEEKRSRGAPVALKRAGIIGRSAALDDCLNLVAQASASGANVLIDGETGTGKELFAVAVHENSARAAKSFVVVDCSALPANLVESVLFGHERGAYTGADRAHDGLVAQADGGTLFLDEVGELPPNVQKAFLRVIQERRFRPVGGSREIESDFRLVAATNRDLDEMVARGQFRDDLLFRMRTIHISLPPLREHKEDIKDLALHYVARVCEQYDIETKGFTPEFFGVLAEYDWPGNVRELNQALERAISSAGRNPLLFPKDLPTGIRAKMARDSMSEAAWPGGTQYVGGASAPPLPRLDEARAAAIAASEELYLQELMAVTAGDVPKACAISGLSRSRLYALLKKHGLRASR